MNDIDGLFLDAIENAAGGNDQLAIRQSTELDWKRSHLRKSPQPSNSRKHLTDQLMSRLRLVQGNIICDRIKVLNRRVSPDYFSHRFSRCLARLWVEIRPSWMAL